jgi:hypothetical protein
MLAPPLFHCGNLDISKAQGLYPDLFRAVFKRMDRTLLLKDFNRVLQEMEKDGSCAQIVGTSLAAYK